MPHPAKRWLGIYQRRWLPDGNFKHLQQHLFIVSCPTCHPLSFVLVFSLFSFVVVVLVVVVVVMGVGVVVVVVVVVVAAAAAAAAAAGISASSSWG